MCNGSEEEAEKTPKVAHREPESVPLDGRGVRSKTARQAAAREPGRYRMSGCFTFTVKAPCEQGAAHDTVEMIAVFKSSPSKEFIIIVGVFLFFFKLYFYAFNSVFCSWLYLKDGGDGCSRVNSLIKGKFVKTTKVYFVLSRKFKINIPAEGMLFSMFLNIQYIYT